MTVSVTVSRRFPTSSIMAMSTPDCNRCMAVVCRKVCGEIDRAFSWGFIWAATSTASASRCVTFERDMALPLRLRNSGALLAVVPERRFQARITLTVDRHSGTLRCLRPLPVRWIDGEVSRIKCKKTDIVGRCNQIRAQVDREKLQERLAKLAGGVAVIRVGGASEVEVKERKDRVDDALHATRASGGGRRRSGRRRTAGAYITYSVKAKGGRAPSLECPINASCYLSRAESGGITAATGLMRV